MDSDRDLLRELLFEALARNSDEERDEYLRGLEVSHPELASDVRELAYWGQQAAESLTTSWRPAPEPDVGDLVGGYRLVSLLGEGGFGRVWRAQARREGLRDVAVKLVLEGVDMQAMLKRFAREKDVLARLEHTGIAAIQDAGRTESGRPFIVMECVQGLPITRYAEDRGLSRTAICELVVRVCRAVEHAHAQGVLHRDLKPSNILVAEEDGGPRPKVIDFGIASMLSSDDGPGMTLTVDGKIVGSPGYMSPEQAGYGVDAGRGELAAPDIDERADVFGLGRILYELVVGAPAVAQDRSAPAQAMQRLKAVFDEGSPSPRAAARAAGRSEVAKDLDQVILKATEVDRSRRYHSVQELRKDLERHLAGEPVVARPSSALERTSRFVRKHRPVIVPTAVLIAALVGSLVWVTGASHRVSLANERLTQTVEVQSSLIDGLDVSSMGRALREELLEQLGAGIEDVEEREAVLASVTQHVDFTTLARGVIARNVLDPAERALAEQLQSDPETRTRLARTILSMRRRLGLLDSRGRTATTIHELTTEAFGEDSPEAIEVLIELGNIASQKGRLEEAESAYQRALVRSREQLGAESDDALRAEGGLAMLMVLRDDYAAAEEAIVDIVERLESSGRAESPLMARTLMNLGLAQERAIRIPEAIESYEKARVLVAAGHAGNAVEAFEPQIRLARLQATQGRADEAVALLDEIVPKIRDRHGDLHINTISALSAQCNARYHAGDHEGALEAATLAYEAHREMVTVTHPETLRLRVNQLKLMNIVSRFEAADAICEAEIPLARSSLAPNHEVLGEFLVQHASALASLAEIDEAWDCLMEGIGIFERGLPPGHSRTRMAYAIASQFAAARHELAPDQGFDEVAAEFAAKLD
ncbi:MAG: protein kinase [Planctomycetota bacterium]